ncbi:hypothetical protein SKL01_02830 [Staphylococcus kloosii]|uniref:Uncharacterized protein n=1 Tax=Staphylococcus kloosii TaxID=29384 RepID=A0ABQ0XI19_9STAP|nr:hypothetical protein SKL01_02830 [Staphylococcus kloosii]
MYDIFYLRMRKGKNYPFNIFLSKIIIVKDFNIFCVILFTVVFEKLKVEGLLI